MEDKIKHYVEDFMEKRMESAIQTFNNLLFGFEDRFEKKLLESVDKQMKVTVNGKIDDLRKENRDYHEKQQSEIQEIKKSLENLKLDTTPVVKDRETITRLGRFIIWIGAIGSAIIGFFKLLKL